MEVTAYYTVGVTMTDSKALLRGSLLEKARQAIGHAASTGSMSKPGNHGEEADHSRDREWHQDIHGRVTWLDYSPAPFLQTCFRIEMRNSMIWHDRPTGAARMHYLNIAIVLALPLGRFLNMNEFEGRSS